MFTRRSFLAAATALCVAPSIALASTLYDVLYFEWSSDIGAALDHLAMVKDAIDEDGAGTFEVVKKGSKYGVLYRMGAESAAAKRLAAVHSSTLRSLEDTDEELAHAVARSDYSRVYNVSYGLGPNLTVLIDHFSKVAGLLGKGVARSLVIEKTDHGNYALVYKRYGDLDGTRDAASRHDRLLRKSGIRASFIQEQSFFVVYDGATIYTKPEPLPEEPAEEITEVKPPPEPEPLLQPVDPLPDIPMEEFIDDRPPIIVPVPAPVAAPEPKPEPVVKPPEPKPEPKPKPQPQPEPVVADPIVTGSTDLSKLINAFIQGERKGRRLASNERTAWLVVDLKAKKTLASINAEASLQAASMIKPLVMLAFFHEVNRGRFTYGSISRAKLEQMIQRSSNSATNWVIDQVGGPAAVQRVLDRHYKHICKQTVVVERIASNGRTYRNKASAADYGRYLQAVWFGELPRAKEQLRLLNLPGRDRLYNGAPSIPTGTAVYNKTGSTARCCGDMGILVARTVSGKPVPYIIVGIIDKSVRTDSYSSWITGRANVIRAVSDRVYRHMKAKYGLR